MALIVRPLPFTAAYEEVQAFTPLRNAAVDEPGLAYRASANSTHFVIDLGTAPVGWDTIALIGTTLQVGDFYRVHSGNDFNTLVSFAVSPTFDSGGKPIESSTLIIHLDRTIRDRFVSVLLECESPRSVNRVVVGKALTFNDLAGVDMDAELTLIDPSTTYAGAGWESFDLLPTLRQWKVSVSFLDDAHWREEWQPFLASVGKSRAFLFAPGDDPATWASDAIFGRIKSDATAKIQGHDARLVELVIRAIL